MRDLAGWILFAALVILLAAGVSALAEMLGNVEMMVKGV